MPHTSLVAGAGRDRQERERRSPKAEKEFPGSGQRDEGADRDEREKSELRFRGESVWHAASRPLLTG